MATTGLGGFLTRVRHTLAADDRADADLLRTFAETRSDPAFAELVRRFAPMVWGVCRRTVGHHQHAEDAFQAVFLVLARKPAAVRPPAAVGGGRSHLPAGTSDGRSTTPAGDRHPHPARAVRGGRPAPDRPGRPAGAGRGDRPPAGQATGGGGAV
ncbi:MAG: sigma factor [Gemmataceae bacterium]